MPTFSNVSPVAGSTLSKATSVSFDVTDVDGLALVFVWATFADGTTEVVWTGDGFGPRYASSTRTAIVNGFTFVVNRAGGWVAAPTVRARAVDSAGETAALAAAYGLQETVKAEPAAVVGQAQPTAAGQPVEVVALGRGLVAPFRRDGKGDWSNESGVALVRANVDQILGTVASSDYTTGEVPWRPEFGSLLHLMRHANNDHVLRELAKQYVVDALELWEPRVRLTSTRIEQDALAGTLSIVVVYDVVSRRRRTPIVSGVQQSFVRKAA